MRRNLRLTITPFSYILMFYAEGKDRPADFLQKQEIWPVGNRFPLARRGKCRPRRCARTGQASPQLRRREG